MARKQSKKSEKNLIPFNRRPVEKKHEIQSKGGKMSVQRRREKRAIRELVGTILSLPLDKKRKPVDLDNIKSFYDLDGANLTPAIAGIIKLAQKVASGDLKAIELWHKLSGEGQQQDINFTGALDVTAKRDFSGLTDEELGILADLVARVNGAER